MERWHKIGLLFTGWLSVTSYSAIAIAGEGIPETLTTRHPNIDKTYPTWVSAAAATQADGSLDSGLFHPVLLDDLQRTLTTPVDPVKGCIPQAEVFQSWTSPPDVSSLESTFRSSGRVLRARVTGRETGFDRGVPGQLFQAERLETYKGGDDLTTVYFFLPVGRVKAGKVEICKTDYRFPHLPEVGDEVVLMPPKLVIGEPLLDIPFEQGFLVLRDSRALLSGIPKGGPQERPRAEVLADLSRLAAEARK